MINVNIYNTKTPRILPFYKRCWINLKPFCFGYASKKRNVILNGFNRTNASGTKRKEFEFFIGRDSRYSDIFWVELVILNFIVSLQVWI